VKVHVSRVAHAFPTDKCFKHPAPDRVPLVCTRYRPKHRHRLPIHKWFNTHAGRDRVPAIRIPRRPTSKHASPATKCSNSHRREGSRPRDPHPKAPHKDIRLPRRKMLQLPALGGIASPRSASQGGAGIQRVARPRMFRPKRPSPDKLVQCAGKRPLFSPRDVPVSDGIFSHILPFAFVTATGTELRIPEISLPSKRQALGSIGDSNVPFPKGYPILQCWIHRIARGAE
jgi:hypothetical protein